jgi:hypothetical protein
MPRNVPPWPIRLFQFAVVSPVEVMQSVKSGSGVVRALPSGDPRPSVPWQLAHASA